MNPSITAEQTQTIESALQTYWAGGEPSDPINVEWLSAYLGLNCLTEANLGSLIAQIYQHALGASLNLRDETRRLALEWVASELSTLSEQSLQQSVSDPVVLGAMLQRVGVQGALTDGDYHLPFMASLLNQATLAQRVFGPGGDVLPTASDVGGKVDALQGLWSAAQKVWAPGMTLSADDGVTLGLIPGAQDISVQQLARLNAVLGLRRDTLSPDQQTFETLRGIHQSVVALEKILNQDPDAVDLTVNDFTRLGVAGVTEANVAMVNAELATSNTPLLTPVDVQTLLDQQVSAALGRVNAAIQQHTTATLTEQDHISLGLVLPNGFDLQRFNSLLAGYTGPLQTDPAQRSATLAQLQALVLASHKLALMSDALPENDQVLSASDFQALSGVAQLGLARFDAQVQNLFNDVFKSQGQRGQGVSSVTDLQQVAQTISDLHRLAAGGRLKAALTSERLANIGIQTEGQQPLSDTVLKGLVSVVTRTESSGAGIDTLGKLNAMVNAYENVLGLADGSANSSTRPTQADYAALRISGVDSEAKASLLGDLLDRKAAGEVDSISKLQEVALLVSKVVAYAGGAQVAVTQTDLERLALQGLNEQKTALVLEQLRARGADSTLYDQIGKIQGMVDAFPAISGVSFSADRGIAGDRITNVASQTISATLGAALQPGVTLQGSLNGGITWTPLTGMVSGTNLVWTGATLLNGTNSLQFKWADAYNVQRLSASTSYTLDTSIPMVSNLSLSNEGLNATDFITSEASQTVRTTLSAPLSAGDKLEGTVDNINWTDITHMVNGTQVAWTGVQLISGTYNLVIRATDMAGNTASGWKMYTLDTELPYQSISHVSFSDDTGSSATDLITKVATQTISATLSAGLNAGDILYGSTKNGSTWTDITSMVSGTAVQWSGANLVLPGYNPGLVFKLQNSLGKSVVSNPISYTLDQTLPAYTINRVILSSDTGTANADLVTNVEQQTITFDFFTGASSENSFYARLDPSDPWTPMNDKIVAGDIVWGGVTLPSGTHTLQLWVIDVAGNEGTYTRNYTLDTFAANPTIQLNDNGSLAVYAATDARTYTVTYTDEASVARTVTVSSTTGTSWTATGLQAGSSLNAATGTLRLGNDNVLDGSTVSTKTTADVAGNASTTNTTATAAVDTLSKGGNPIIDLGSYGKLMAPVQVEGKWYYMWDINGNGSITSADQQSMDWLESAFFGSSTGTVVTASNRTFMLNGVQVMLPTLGTSATSLQGTSYSSTVDDPVANSNSTYDDLAAVWDAFNGSGTVSATNGTPRSWGELATIGYWSANPSDAGRHKLLAFNGGSIFNESDSDMNFFALQVL